MSSGKAVIIGAGSHARAVVEILRRAGNWDVVGVIDEQTFGEDEKIFDVPVIGTLDNLAEIKHRTGATAAFIAIGHNERRRAFHGLVSASGFATPALIHPSAIVEPEAEVSGAVVICAGAILGAAVRVGTGALINTGAIIDHDSVIGDFAHIAPGCRLAGKVSVGQGTMIGIGSTIIDRRTIGRNVIIGAGSVVIGDIPDGVVAMGVPAKVRRDHA